MNIIESALRVLEANGFPPIEVYTGDGPYRTRSVAETLDVIEDYEEVLIMLRGGEWIKVIPYERDPEDRIADWSIDLDEFMEGVLP